MSLAMNDLANRPIPNSQGGSGETKRGRREDGNLLLLGKLEDLQCILEGTGEGFVDVDGQARLDYGLGLLEMRATVDALE